MKKLNLGCGNRIMEGYINVDYTQADGVDMVWDLEEFPYPFDDEEIDEIYANHVIEHLEPYRKVMGELSRILKKGGKLILAVPHPCWSLEACPYHKVRFNVGAFHYLIPGYDQIEQDALFSEILDLKITFHKGKHIYNYFVEWFVNLNDGIRNFYGQTCLCYLFPPYSIYCVLKK